MIKIALNKSYLRLKRYFGDPEFVFNFYSLWVLMILVNFVVFAYRPLIKLIIEKQQLVLDLRNVNSNLDTNILKLEQFRQGVLTDLEALALLDLYMPQKYEVQNYIEQFSNAVSSAGFVLKTIGAADSGAKSLVISARLTGPGDFPRLIKNLESLKRLTTINGAGYVRDSHSFVQEDADVNISVSIYSLEASK